MGVDRIVLACPAALSDLRMLVPRTATQAIVIRHAMKLANWTQGADSALDLEVVEIPQSVIRELRVDEGFGFHYGLRLAFFEDTQGPQDRMDGTLWVIGLRRDDEPLSSQMMATLNHRKALIEEYM